MSYPGPHEDFDSGTAAWDEDHWDEDFGPFFDDWEDETMVDLGGGMVVRLSELIEDESTGDIV